MKTLSPLESLAVSIKLIDTGLRGATLTALSTQGRLSSGDVIEYFHSNDLLDVGTSMSEKRVEAVRLILNSFVEAGIASAAKVRVATGQQALKFSLNESDYTDFLRDAASDMMTYASLTQTPVHELWRVRGGSYSTELKPIRQGIDLSAFYGLSRDGLNSYEGSQSLSGPSFKLRGELADLMGIDPRVVNHHLAKFQKMGLVERTHTLRKNNEYGAAPNARAYRITTKGELFVEDAFLPQLEKIKGNKPINRSSTVGNEELKDALTLHYSGFKNQYSSLSG